MWQRKCFLSLCVLSSIPHQCTGPRSREEGGTLETSCTSRLGVLRQWGERASPMAAPCPGGWPAPQQGHCATCCPYAHTQQKEPEGPVSCLPSSPATISSRGVPAPYPGNVCKCFFLMGDHVGPPGAPSPSIPTLVPVHVACKSLPVFGRAVLPLSTPTPPISLVTPLCGLGTST